MAEALKNYWYLALLLAVVTVFTGWVVSKAYKASKRASEQREAQLKRLEYEKSVSKEFAELDDGKLSSAEPKRAFDGVALNLQKRIEKATDMDAEFNSFSPEQKVVYALYYLAEDTDGKALSEFFKCNSAPLTPCALEGVRLLLPRKAVKAFEAEYNAYDPDNEETSLISAEIERLDKQYESAVEDFNFYAAGVEYIRKNIVKF